MKIIDAHTHISGQDFDEDRPEVLKRAFQVCDYLIDIGVGEDPEACLRAKELSEKLDAVYFTAGVHPHDAGALHKSEGLKERIEGLHEHPKCVAVGECGLDYYYDHSTPEEQKPVFRWQISLAENRRMPLMIHTRDAEKDTMDILNSYQGDAVFHCFTGSQELAEFGVSKGFMISFSGIVTFKKAEELRQTFLSLPLENILIETDSPYLAPVPKRGKRNESSFIQHTAEFLAELRGIPTQDFIDQTSANALNFFQKIKHECSQPS